VGLISENGGAHRAKAWAEVLEFCRKPGSVGSRPLFTQTNKARNRHPVPHLRAS
jgi:hypothetical protein